MQRILEMSAQAFIKPNGCLFMLRKNNQDLGEEGAGGHRCREHGIFLESLSDLRQRPKTGLEPSKVVLYHFAQHSVRHGDPLGRYGGRYNAPPLASRHRLQTLGT